MKDILGYHGISKTGKRAELVQRICGIGVVEEVDTKKISAAIMSKWFMKPYVAAERSASVVGLIAEFLSRESG